MISVTLRAHGGVSHVAQHPDQPQHRRRAICRRERTSPSELCRRIEKLGLKGGRTSAMRVYVLQYFRAAATEEGHIAAGHGMADHSRTGGNGSSLRASMPVFLSRPAE